MGKERKKTPTRILEKLFQEPEDLEWAWVFVHNIVASHTAAVRADVVREMGANNSVPTIIVIHESMDDGEKAEMINGLNNSHNVLGRDAGRRLRFGVTVVDEASIPQNRENSPEFVGKKIFLLWERPHEPAPTAA